jgi:DNA-binding response OmpR family regulator
MILFVSSSNREAAALVTACDHRSWAAYICPTVREFHPLTEKIQPRAIVVRHRLLDGYSDDILASLNSMPPAARPRIIVLMSADRTAQTEARQIALGADCVLHDPVRMEILLEYLAKYRIAAEASSGRNKNQKASFRFAGAEVHPQEHRLVRDMQSLRLSPQEIALLSILHNASGKVVPYHVLYGDLFTRRFEGDTANCRVLLGKLSASFNRIGIELKPFIQVIPKSGYLYLPKPARDEAAPPIPKVRSKRHRPSTRGKATASRRTSNR